MDILKYVLNLIKDYWFFGGLPSSAELYLRVLVAFNVVFGLLILVMYFHQGFYTFFALFTRAKKWREAKVRHKYAYMICAHDEEKAIGNLIDSIFAQDYPKDLMKVFVCADNCTDDTAKIARERGAVVFERYSNERGKSYALDYMIKRVLAEYAEEKFDAAFVFDADNLVTANYTEEMNKLYDAGYKAATSFRASKNVGQNWVTAGSSYMFYRECALVHHSRSKLDFGTYVSGTGFYVAMELLEEMGGWNYHTITEDIEFSLDCALKKIKIGYNENAVFYDEQPQKLRDSCAQRLRWCRGMHECFNKYYFKEFKNTVKSGLGPIRFEMFVHVCPLSVISFVWTILYQLLLAAAVFGGKFSASVEHWYITMALPSFGISVAGMYLALVACAFIFVGKAWKRIDMPAYKKIFYCFTFPVIFTLGVPIWSVAIFKKVRWTKIPHTVSKSIGDFGTK